MTSQYRIMTRHPDGKQGVNIAREKYDLIRCTILEILQDERELPFLELGRKIKERLGDNFDGSVTWYYTTVKLDLEARGEIERVPGKTPQHLKLVDAPYC